MFWGKEKVSLVLFLYPSFTYPLSSTYPLFLAPSFLLSTDVQFWRSRKTLEGLSVRSVFFNVFQSLVVLLYILDHETNYVIIVSVFVGGWALECTSGGGEVGLG